MSAAAEDSPHLIPLIEVSGHMPPVIGEQVQSCCELAIPSNCTIYSIKEQGWYDCTEQRVLKPDEKFVENREYRQYAILLHKTNQTGYIKYFMDETQVLLDGSTDGIDRSRSGRSDTGDIYSPIYELWSKPVKATDHVSLSNINIDGFMDPTIKVFIEEYPALTITQGAGYSIEKSGWWRCDSQNRWMVGTETIFEGLTYQQGIVLKLQTGYHVDENTTYTLNGGAVAVDTARTGYENGYVTIFSEPKLAQEPKKITRIEIDGFEQAIMGAETGSQCHAAVAADALYTVGGQSWNILNGTTYLRKTDRFTKGNLYYSSVTVKTKPGYIFDEDAVCILNGGEVECFQSATYRQRIDSYSDRYFIVTAEPEYADPGIVIPMVEIEGPEVPESLHPVEEYSTHTVPEDAGYFIQDISWLIDEYGRFVWDGEAFERTHSYTLYITLEAKQGYSFDENTVGYLNGKKLNGQWSAMTVRPNQIRLTGELVKPISCPSEAFRDVWQPPHWAHEGIDYCVSRSYMQGMSKDTFEPKGTVNRAQLVTILYRMAGSPAVERANVFSDVPIGRWYADAVVWASENKIVNGYPDGTFRPMDAITREQIAAILYRYCGSPKAEGDLQTFPDAATVSTYALDAMAWAVDKGLLTGIKYEVGTLLAPKQNASREQIATIIMRFDSMETEPVCEHDYARETIVEPTCIDHGTTSFTCSKCGDSYTIEELPALGHDFDPISHVCTRCGEAEAC